MRTNLLGQDSKLKAALLVLNLRTLVLLYLQTAPPTFRLQVVEQQAGEERTAEFRVQEVQLRVYHPEGAEGQADQVQAVR